MSKPQLSMKEEARVGTLSHCVTMMLFRPLDTLKMRRADGRTRLLAGWPKQCATKILDDELFNANVDRIVQIAEDQYGVKHVIENTYTKAAVGVLARCLTLTVMVPVQKILDPAKRKDPNLYAGFPRQALKESVFTASYVISSAHIGDYLLRFQPYIKSQVRRAYQCPVSRCLKPADADCVAQEKREAERVDKTTAIVLQAAKAAAAGAVSTLVTAPIDYYGKKTPLLKAVVATNRKAFRKGCYNAVNTSINKTIQLNAYHRVFLPHLRC